MLYFIDHLPDRRVQIQGLDYLYFSGTAYLGLPQNTAFRALLQRAFTQYGHVYGSSRNGNLQLQIYDRAEAQLACFTGAPAALTLSSGMLAGQAVVRYLMAQHTEFYYGPDTHPAVWHLPNIEPFRVHTPHDIPKDISVTTSKQCYVTNAVDALHGHLHDFGWLKDWPSTQPLVLLIDDSHGLGITGQGGAGVWSRMVQQPHVQCIVTASLAKAMGLSAGVILADASTLEAIRHTSYFGGGSPAAPYQLEAYLEAQPLYHEAQQRLRANVEQFAEGVKDLGLFESINDFPVFYTTHHSLYQFLLTQGILIYSFAYPNPAGIPNTRVVLSAWHTPQDIQILIQGCKNFKDIEMRNSEK